MHEPTDELYATTQAYLAVSAITTSALRNQGAAGVIQAAQDFLKTLDLHRFTVTEERAFRTVLDTVTEELRQQLPTEAQHWGAARKALNLFLRDVCYNRFLSPKYGLAMCEPWMEIPLDTLVAEALTKYAKEHKQVVPAWARIKGLTPSVSQAFQDVACAWANAERITRPHLDMRIWTTRRPTKKITKTES